MDKGLDAATLAGLALELRDVRANDMVMFTLPTPGIGTSTDGQSIVRRTPGPSRTFPRHWQMTVWTRI